MAIQLNEAAPRRATRALPRYVIPVLLRWATTVVSVAVLLFGTAADALWAIGALSATGVTPPQ